MNIALICLYGMENNGIRIISSVLRKKGFNAHVIFFKRWINNDIHPPSEKDKEILIALLKELKTDMVGIGFTSPFLKIAEDITVSIKNAIKLPIVWGGVHATAKPEECLEYCDIACRGEGEHAMLDIAMAYAKGASLTGIRNICYKLENKIILEEMRPLIQDLNSLPHQDYGGHNKYFIDNGLWNTDPLVNSPELRIFASRGCPFSCSYCYNDILKKLYEKEKYYRIKSAESVILEIEYGLGIFKNIKKIKFDDDTFVFPKDWIDEFCQKYKKRIALPFEILFNAACLDEKVLSKLKSAGLRRAQVGIQTGSSRESEEIYNRDLSLGKIQRFARTAKDLNLEVVYDVILDNPLATFEDKEALLDFLLSLPRPFDIFIYSLTVFPGTSLCDMFLNKGLIKKEDVEGKANKSFNQFRLSLSYPRKKEELFVACLVSLASKSFIPKGFILFLKKNSFLKTHPIPLKWFAQFCNYIKLLFILIKMLICGEVNMWKFKEYGSPRRSLIQ